MREDRRDLRRHGVGRVRKVWPDEDFKMAVRAQPVIPALADRLAFGSGAGEADRHADSIGQGGVHRLEQRSHAQRHRIEPAFTIVLFHRLISKIACRAMACCHRSRVRAEQRGERGQRESAGVVRAQGAKRLSHGPADCGCRGEGGSASLSRQANEPAGAPAPLSPRSAHAISPAMWIVTEWPRPCAGLGSAATRATVPRKRQAQDGCNCCSVELQ